MEPVAKRWSPEGPLDTPYRRARQEWDARMGSALVQAKNWRMVAVLSLGLVGVALVGLIILGAKPKVVPHIVEIDALGAATYRGPVSRAASEAGPSEPAIKYHVRRFVTDTRSLSSDPSVVKQNWLEAYAWVTQAGANMLTAYVNQHEPFKRLETERVGVEILAVVPVSRDTWQVDWRESSWSVQGNALGAGMWRGMFRVVLHPPDSADTMANNPIGLYVDEFHWDQIQHDEPPESR